MTTTTDQQLITILENQLVQSQEVLEDLERRVRKCRSNIKQLDQVIKLQKTLAKVRLEQPGLYVNQNCPPAPKTIISDEILNQKHS